jgi:uncharacterized protein YqgC (DUF456 family)
VELAVAIAVGLAMAVGLVGTIVPVLPGLAIVWLAALVYGLAAGFGTAGTLSMVVITVLAVAGTLAGVLLPSRAAGTSGAGVASVRLGVLGAVVGFFAVPVVGIALGGALGIFVGERVRTRDTATAWRATVATLKGFGLGALAELAAGILMALTWVAWLAAG